MTYEPVNRNSRQPVRAFQREDASAMGEAIGFVVIAVVAMGLLAVGYNIRPTTADIAAQQQTTQPTTAQPTTALGATPQTQDRGAGNATPSAPTSSTSGQGPTNGSTGTPTSNAPANAPKPETQPQQDKK